MSAEADHAGRVVWRWPWEGPPHRRNRPMGPRGPSNRPFKRPIARRASRAGPSHALDSHPQARGSAAPQPRRAGRPLPGAEAAQGGGAEPKPRDLTSHTAERVRKCHPIAAL